MLSWPMKYFFLAEERFHMSNTVYNSPHIQVYRAANTHGNLAKTVWGDKTQVSWAKLVMGSTL